MVAQHIRISVGEEQQEEMLPVETADEVVGIGQQAEEPVVEDTDHETTMQTRNRRQGKTAIVRQAGTNCIFRKKQFW